MRVLVGVKRVVDYAVKVRIQPDKAGTAIISRISYHEYSVFLLF